jgi:hypothetical protein
VVCAWEDGDEWDEPMVWRRGNEALALDLVEQAEQLNLGLIMDLKEVLQIEVKTLVIQES